MAVTRGKFTYASGDVLDQDDLTGLEAQTIRAVNSRAELGQVFGVSPAAGIAWITDTAELVGWDGTRWVTITSGYIQSDLLAGLPGVAQSADTVRPETVTDWHDPSTTPGISARNYALTGDTTRFPTPFGDTAGGDYSEHLTGNCLAWRQSAGYAAGHTVTLTVRVPCEIQVLAVARGGNGAAGRSLIQNSVDVPAGYRGGIHLAGGGGGGGEVRAVRVRLGRGQRLSIHGLAVVDGGGIQIRVGTARVVSVLRGAAAVQENTPVRGTATVPIPSGIVPAAGASQRTSFWQSRVVRPAPAYDFYSYGATTTQGGQVAAGTDIRYAGLAGFFHGKNGGKASNPNWWWIAGHQVPLRFRPNTLGGAGAGGSMRRPGDDAVDQTVDGKEGTGTALNPGFVRGGAAVRLDDAYWPVWLARVGSGGKAWIDRQINLQAGTSTGHVAPTQSTWYGSGGDGGSGDAPIAGVAHAAPGTGRYGAAVVRFPRLGEPLAPYMIDYT